MFAWKGKKSGFLNCFEVVGFSYAFPEQLYFGVGGKGME